MKKNTDQIINVLNKSLRTNSWHQEKQLQVHRLTTKEVVK